MIKKMRLKFIIISLGALILLHLAIFTTVNLFMKQHSIKVIDGFLNNVLENGGLLHQPNPPQGRPPGHIQPIKGFFVQVIGDDTYYKIIFDDQYTNVLGMDEHISQIIKEKRYDGIIDTYRFKVKAVDNGFYIAFADTSIQDSMLTELLRISYTISLISLGILILLILISSKYITKPVEEAFEIQKRFIADSSHELKTPLSILSCNMDLLQMELGKNDLIDSMKSSVKRMNDLIHNLLILAKTESKKDSFETFNLSKAIKSTILSLEVLAYESGKSIEGAIEDHIMYNGHETSIKIMIKELLENAIKYSKDNSVITVGLSQKGESKIIKVYNEGVGVTKEQKNRLFDKFYRVDGSRQRETGGYGLGLSIVKNIVDMHKGKIQVESIPNKYIIFKVTLPQ